MLSLIILTIMLIILFETRSYIWKSLKSFHRMIHPKTKQHLDLRRK